MATGDYMDDPTTPADSEATYMLDHADASHPTAPYLPLIAPTTQA
jgi:hypothetical protein